MIRILSINCFRFLCVPICASQLKPPLLTEIASTKIWIRIRLNHYIHVKQWSVISFVHPCPIFNRGSLKPPLKLSLFITPHEE